MDTGSVHEPKNAVDIEAYVEDQMVDGGRRKRKRTRVSKKSRRRLTNATTRRKQT